MDNQKDKIEKELRELEKLANEIKKYTHDERDRGIILDTEFYQDYGYGDRRLKECPQG